MSAATRSPDGDQPGAPSAWKSFRRWLHEPLVHFIAAGALIFSASVVLGHGTGKRNHSDTIEITQYDLDRIAVAWMAQGRPAPTLDQMQALVEQSIREEIMAREAVSLGLDKNDEIIKRRLAQKMDFLAADIALLQDPSEADLRTWFTANADRFALPARASFRHIYFSFDRGPRARNDAALVLAKITDKPADTRDGVGSADPFSLRTYYADRTLEEVAREFGPAFANALFQTSPGSWQGPIASGYGWHVVFVEERNPGRVPSFEEVAPDVKSAWLEDKQSAIRRAAYDGMRARYAINIAPITNDAERAWSRQSRPAPVGGEQ